MPDQPVASPSVRDQRIDLIRGLALAMIFVNHVPGNPLERLTSRNFGFSDAAEAFVMLAGVSAALAYGRPAPGWVAALRPWRRAWTLWLVHLMLSLVVLGIVAGLMRFGGIPAMMAQDNFQALAGDPVGVFVGLPLMLHQFGYVNILPLYILLLLAAPGMLGLARRWPVALLAGSGALWLAAGLARVNFLTYPGLNGWFLNPLSWQLLFVLGLLTGLRLKAGARLVPAHPRLVALAAGYAVLALLWVSFPAVAETGRAALGALAEGGVPRLLVQFDKTYLELPRLLHVLALAYLASAWPGLRALAASRPVWMLTAMGRQALPVFALGTVLAFALRALRLLLEDAGLSPAPPVFAAMVLAGLALQVGLAVLIERARPDRAITPAGAGHSRRMSRLGSAIPR